MRSLTLYLPILLAQLFACKIKQAPLPDLRFPSFRKAESFFKEGNYDSAFYYCNAITNRSQDSIEIATAYTYMGIIQDYGGDYFGAQESLLAALTLLDERQEAHHYCLQSIFHELSVNNQNLKNYEAAIRYSLKAIPLTVDKVARITALNTLATTYRKKGDYLQADSIYTTILDSIGDNQKEYARILSNQARTRWLHEHHYPAGPQLLQALSIRQQIKDDWGVNASYAHLADFYTDTHPDSALYYARRRYSLAQQINSPDDELEALMKLLFISPPNKVKEYIVRYQHLNDSVQTARAAAKNQFALVRYESEKSKTDNLQLQKSLFKQQVVFWLAIVFFAAAAIVVRIWYRKRKQQMESSARLAIQANQLKTSQKVHDVVANRLYRIMADIEYKETIEKEPLLDEIEALYERSRDISYEPAELPHQDFQHVISGMLKAFGGAGTKVVFTGNNQPLWDSITPKAQQEVEQVLQELMINMKKHSKAEKVLIKFETGQNNLHIHYSDDGIGLPPDFKNGNGLTNTGNRINGIGGNITFEQSTKGVKIRITIPTVSTT